MTGMDAATSDGGSKGREAYQVVARRFRPQTFNELVGQEEVLRSLRSALEQDRVPHSFVFSGSRGVGKTTSARILARCLNCDKGPTPDPCGTCNSCVSILAGSNPDVIEVDAASNNGVDDVRRLRESVSFATMQSRYRVVILDEAHMMSKAAFNAFLKTLEEPPPKVVFILATTELHRLPDTIRSRCQVLLFKRVGEEDLQKRLRMIAEQDGVTVADEVLAEIASSVRGGVRDAETALERVLPLARDLGDKFDLAAYRTLTSRLGADAVVDVVAALMAGDAKRGLHFANDLQQHGTDEREALGEIVDMLRWVMLLKVDGEDSVLVPLTGAIREQVQAIAKGADSARLDAMIGAGLLGRDRLRRLEDRSAVFEVALVRMAQAGSMPTLADLLAEVRSGGFAPHAPAETQGGGRQTQPPGRPQPAARAAAPAAAPRPATIARPTGPVANAKELKSRAMVLLESRKMLQATLELCRVEGPSEQGKVVVTLETERKMHIDRLKSAVIEQEVKEAVREAAGREVTVEIRIGTAGGGSESAAPSGAKTPAAPEAKPGEKAQAVIKKFGGRVVQVNPPDRIQKPAPSAPEEEEIDPGDPSD
ncbi:MAG: DNA polymerase-3 subunit gamma/tau [Neolewinella sp.]|jgi:DNA polymerase-3 subunit gamma/tau